MKKIKIGLIALLAMTIFFSCNKQDLSRTPATNNQTTNPIVPCGVLDVHTLWAGQNINAGTVTVSNDETYLYVTYATTGGWVINKTHLYVGNCSLIPTTPTGNPKIGLFPYNMTFSPSVTTYTYTIALDQLDSCYCVAAHAELVQLDGNGNIIDSQTGWASGDDFGGASWATKFEYCTQVCESTPPCTINDGDFRTQTQGGWGASPAGNNPGVYMQANFSAAFPTGLVVGCGSNTITLTSGQAVTNFLPQGGTAAAISGAYINPTSQINVLAGQLVSATLSVTFDAYDAGFSSSDQSLGNLLVASGTFAGWTVNQVLAEANLVFGGCSTAHTAQQMNEVLTSINENFDNGTVNNGFLTCN